MGISIGTFGRVRSAIAATAFAIFLTASAPALADKRVALIVGMSAYQHVPRLENPGNDARLIAETLRGLGFTLIGNEPVLDRDKTGLENAIQDFSRQIQGADVALFYYSGHGMQVRGENYLIPVSANPMREADIDFNLIDINVVLRQMEQAGTKFNVVILDACRNNPFAGRGFRALSRGLAQMDAPEGTIISYATAPGNVALDGDQGNSPYTKALAQTMRQPGLSILDVFNDVGVAVMQATGNFQRPWLASSPLKGRFYFAGEQLAAVVAPPIAPSPAVTTPAPTPKPQVAVVTPPGAPKPPVFETTMSGTLKIIFYPWAKFCETSGKKFCATVKDGRAESGVPIISLALIEPEGEPRKVLRLSFPPGVMIQNGSRLIIDQGTPLTAPIVTCLPASTAGGACISDYEASAKLVDSLKKGKTLTAQAMQMDGTVVSLEVPLRDFVKAYTGPPTDSKVYEEQIKQELQRQSEEARRGVEQREAK